jgi:hypothetical protein
MFEAKEHFVRTLPTVALALFLWLAGPIAARAEIVAVPPAGPPNSTETLPPPTVLRGFPPRPPKPVPVCPPGYALSPDFGCMAQAAGEYAEGWSGYNYWPDDWYGYPGFGFPFFVNRSGHFHRFPGFRGFDHPAKFGGFGMSTRHMRGLGVGGGHMGGFGRR